ncbi:hypothetical protein ACROYT_G028213 [Oculina patagonica]
MAIKVFLLCFALFVVSTSAASHSECEEQEQSHDHYSFKELQGAVNGDSLKHDDVERLLSKLHFWNCSDASEKTDYRKCLAPSDLYSFAGSSPSQLLNSTDFAEVSPLIIYCLLPAAEKNAGQCEVSFKNHSELFNLFARNFSEHGEQGITHEALDHILEEVNKTIGQFLKGKKLPNTSTQDILAIRKRLLRSAINKRTKEYKKLLFVKNKLMSDIGNIFNGVDFYVLKKSVGFNVKKAVDKVIKTHTKKLQQLTRNTVLPFTSKETVTNLSSCTLTSQQLDALKYGLTNSICPPQINKADVFTCFELMNGTLTKHLKDRKQKGKVVSDLSHIANSYVLAHRPTVADLKKYKILKELRKNPDIVILKPDKGNGVVILNRTDYDVGVLKIISDSTKFKPIKEDPTLLREGQLQRFLRKLKSKGHLEPNVYSKIFQSGSQPARIYGLPKMHKPRGPNSMPPFRPIVSSIGTYNYELAKYLCSLLQPHIHLIIVLRIVSRLLMKSKIYRYQVDGVSMGSPLAPVLANLFMGHNENAWLENYKDSRILYYRRYVDDTFCVFETEQDAVSFYNFINSQHPNISFTMEKECFSAESIFEEIEEQEEERHEDEEEEEHNEEEEEHGHHGDKKVLNQENFQKACASIVLRLVQGFCIKESRGHNETDSSLPSKDFFIKDLYKDKEHLSEGDLEEIMEILGIGKVYEDSSKEDDSGDHGHGHDHRRKRSAGSVLLPQRASGAPHGVHRRAADDHDDHDHETNATSGSCYSLDDMLTVFGIDHSVGADMREFKELCPAFIQQTKSGACKESDKTKEDEPEKNTVSSAIWGYAFLAVTIISITSFVGVATIPFLGKSIYKKILAMLVALAVGSLAGDSLLHLLPHAFGLHQHEEEGKAPEEEKAFIWKALLVLSSVYAFYLFETVMHLCLKSRIGDHNGHSHSDIQFPATSNRHSFKKKTICSKLEHHEGTLPIGSCDEKPPMENGDIVLTNVCYPR